MKTEEGLLNELTDPEQQIKGSQEAEEGHKKREGIFRRNEKQYKDLIELANSIVLRLDTKGTIVFLNDFGRKFFGYKKREIIGKNLVGTIVPHVESSGRDLEKLMESIFQTPEEHVINENENIRRDGTRVWVLWTNRAVLDKANEVVGILSIGSDITERKEAEKVLQASRDELERRVEERTSELKNAYEDLRYEIVERKIGEEALRESEAKYRSIVENAAEGIFQTTEGGDFILANAALAQMLGYETPEDLSSSVTDVESQLYVNRQAYLDFERQLKAKGQVKGFEVEYYGKDGEIIWVSMSVRAVYDERGSFICYEGTIVDITAQKESEKRLRESLTKLQCVVEGTIKALSMVVEIRDPYTAGHQIKVTQLATAIGREMNFSEERIKAIGTAGILHDIGKIYVPAEILTRPGKLSDHEIAVLRDHSQAGHEILKDIEFDSPVAEIVLQHHERLDGTGYPRGLSGDQINLDARIIAVADVVESMGSHRPYRPSLGMDAALREIEENRGKLYDAEVVDVCLRLFRERRFSFER